MKNYDAIIIGGGPAGERAAVQAARLGKKVAIIEKEHVVGGTCINWGAIPSKTLRESALFVRSITTHNLHGIQCELPEEITVSDIMYREKLVVQRELELVNKDLDNHGVDVYHGHGRLIDKNTVMIEGSKGQSRVRLQGDFVFLATGTIPNHPPDIQFDHHYVFDSDSILRLPKLPKSMIVLGAGVIGIEYAAIFAALNIQVTLIDTRRDLLPYLDREIAHILERELKRLGVLLISEDHYKHVDVQPQQDIGVRVITRLDNVLEADVLLYCVGRNGNTSELNLDAIGIEANQRGLLAVNNYYQTSVPNIYAIGDVIGYPALASTSMEQGRQAIKHAFKAQGPKGRTDQLPFAIYSIPEVSFIGKTQEQLQEENIPYVIGRGLYKYNPRGQIIDDHGGLLKLIFHANDLTLLGAHIVGTNASEIIHIAQSFMSSNATAKEIAENLYNYPTLADLYRHAALDILRNRKSKRSVR